MTSRERVIQAILRREVDYVPCSPYFNSLTPQQRVGRRYQFPWGPSGREKIVYCVEQLGVDPVVPVEIGSQYPEAGVSSKVWLHDNVIHKVWTTPSGELSSAVRYNEQWPHGLDIPFYSDFNVAHVIKPWLENEADLRCMRHIFHPPSTKEQMDTLRFFHQEAKSLAERHNLATMASIGLGLTGALLLCGAEKLCLMIMDNPALVEEFLEFEHRINIKNMEIAIELGTDIIRRNGFYETADFYSPGMLRKFLGGHLAKEIDTVHQGGKVIGYTVHTGVMPMLDYLAGLPFDCIMHLDTAFKGVDLSLIREKMSEKKSFWTGPSNTYHMWSEDPGVVREAVREVFSAFGKKGLIVTACPSSHSIMPWENTLAMIDEWKKLR